VAAHATPQSNAATATGRCNFDICWVASGGCCTHCCTLDDQHERFGYLSPNTRVLWAQSANLGGSVLPDWEIFAQHAWTWFISDSDTLFRTIPPCLHGARMKCRFIALQAGRLYSLSDSAPAVFQVSQLLQLRHQLLPLPPPGPAPRTNLGVRSGFHETLSHPTMGCA
jgi:hypothetical protein